jgi:hypothetical protein
MIITVLSDNTRHPDNGADGICCRSQEVSALQSWRRTLEASLAAQQAELSKGHTDMNTYLRQLRRHLPLAFVFRCVGGAAGGGVKRGPD